MSTLCGEHLCFWSELRCNLFDMITFNQGVIIEATNSYYIHIGDIADPFEEVKCGVQVLVMAENVTAN